MGVGMSERAEYIEYLQDRLNLHHWSILWSSSLSLGDERAQVVFQQDEREATIRIGPVENEVEAQALIRHEMLHILMTDLEFIACNGRSTDIMELFNRELERVINQLAGALS